jgi:protein DJ-1
VIPGGAKGADTISKSSAVQELVRKYLMQKKIVGMICAGTQMSRSLTTRFIMPFPAGSLTALTSKLPHQCLTSHPSVKLQLENGSTFSAPFEVV